MGFDREQKSGNDNLQWHNAALCDCSSVDRVLASEDLLIGKKSVYLSALQRKWLLRELNLVQILVQIQI